jgi:uncharacterized protein (DUF885 family)
MAATINSRSLMNCLFSAVVTAVISGCVIPTAGQGTSRGPSAADSAFDAVEARYLKEMLAFTPVAATQLGDHRFDDRVDDVTPATREQQAALARSLLDELAVIDKQRLSRAHQVDARLLKNELEYTLWQIEELQEWRWNPLQYTNLAGSAVYSLVARDFAPPAQRLTNVAARLEALPKLLAQVREVLEPARVPRIHAETAIKQNPGVMTLIEELVLPKIGVLSPADQSRLKSAVERARTAVSQHQIWLEKRLLPEAKGDFRLGAQRYDTKLRFALVSTLSRSDIRSRAEAELARVRDEMYGIARTVLIGRPKAPPLPDQPTDDERQTAIVAALELAYAEAPKRDQVFDSVATAVQDTQRFVREKDLVTLYDDPLKVIPMPEFQRGVALAYCDPPGALDKGLDTYYAVSPIPEDWTTEQVRSFLREYNTRSIHNLTIHEAMPGHYLQLMHANRYESPLRAVLASGTFIEGWAVYTERVMVEQGYMNNDPLMRLIQLKWYLRTIGNALLDQAVHVDGITRDAAMRLMMHDTFQEEREAAGKWVRAQLTSAQLPTYFVGAQEHLALREEARQKWGTEFALKRYHDTVLSFGSPPVRYVRALMFELSIEE